MAPCSRASQEICDAAAKPQHSKHRLKRMRSSKSYLDPYGPARACRSARPRGKWGDQGWRDGERNGERRCSDRNREWIVAEPWSCDEIEKKKKEGSGEEAAISMWGQINLGVKWKVSALFIFSVPPLSLFSKRLQIYVTASIHNPPSLFCSVFSFLSFPLNSIWLMLLFYPSCSAVSIADPLRSPHPRLPPPSPSPFPTVDKREAQYKIAVNHNFTPYGLIAPNKWKTLSLWPHLGEQSWWFIFRLNGVWASLTSSFTVSVSHVDVAGLHHWWADV